MSTVEAPTSLRILAVDDEAALRETLSRSFAREGHVVEAAVGGEEAIARANAEHYDVILLDVSAARPRRGASSPLGACFILRLSAVTIEGEEEAPI